MAVLEGLVGYIRNYSYHIKGRKFATGALLGQPLTVAEISYLKDLTLDGGDCLLGKHIHDYFTFENGLFRLILDNSPKNFFSDRHASFALEVYKLWVYLIDYCVRPMPAIINDDTFYTGGMLSRFYDGLPPGGDINIFIKPGKRRDNLIDMLRRGLFLSIIKDNAPETEERWKKYFNILVPGKKISNYAIHLTAVDPISNYGLQFIYCHDSLEPRDVTANFDMLHCQPFIDMADGILYMSQNQYKSIVNREINVVNPQNRDAVPEPDQYTTDIRMQKLLERGWTDVS